MISDEEAAAGELVPERSGRRYISVTDHVYGGTATNDPPGSHGHIRDAALQGGMPRAIGHGKHHINVRDHIEGGSALDERPGSHGHSKDDDFEGGLQRAIGHGRRHLAGGLEAFGATAPPAPGGRCWAHPTLGSGASTPPAR